MKKVINLILDIFFITPVFVGIFMGTLYAVEVCLHWKNGFLMVMIILGVSLLLALVVTLYPDKKKQKKRVENSEEEI